MTSFTFDHGTVIITHASTPYFLSSRYDCVQLRLTETELRLLISEGSAELARLDRLRSFLDPAMA